jgi:hypothetical protein
MTTTYEPGNRVRDRKWGGTETGTITRVDTPADLAERRAEDPDDDGTLYVYVKWDGTSFSEDQLHPREVELIPGTGDPEVGYAIFESR